MPSTPSTRSELPRGALELSVLASVARLAADAYGLGIRRDVSTRLGRDYAVGAIYTTLARLEAKGLLRSTHSEPLPVRGGRTRRQYHLTAVGAAAITEARLRESTRWDGLDHLLAPESL
jgi:DNA-binding PadR family transcriptional regulator